MIETRLKGGLGDFLFQYCFARLLALHLDVTLVTSPLPGFPETRRIATGSSLSRTFAPIVRWSGHAPFDHSTMRPLSEKWTEFCDEARNCRVILDGFFQRARYYTSAHETLAKWLKRPPRQQEPPGNFLICIDSELPGWFPDLTQEEEREYHIQSSRVSPAEVNILADQVDHTQLVLLAREKPLDRQLYPASAQLIVEPSPWRRFDIIQQFSKVSFSQSPLQWWAVFLSSKAQEIYFPNCSLGHWSQPHPPSDLYRSECEGIDLRVPSAAYVYDWWRN